MNLKDFVCATLNQIAEGVCESQKRYDQLGGVVNPFCSLEMLKPLNDISSVSVTGKGFAPVSAITFDVALTEETTKDKGAGGKAGISILRAEGGLSKRDFESSVSRVRFTIPVILPNVKY